MSFDVPNWAAALIALIGSLGGSYIGVRLAVTRLETQMLSVVGRLDKHDDWIEAHDKQYEKDIRQFAILTDRAGLSK